MATDLTTSEFDATTSEGIAFVDFYTTRCPPCRAIAPTIDKLSEEYAGKATIVKVNALDEPELAARFGVMSVPTFVILKDGQEIKRLGVAASNRAALVAAIDEALEGPKLEW